jgi:hypothetical protein
MRQLGQRPGSFDVKSYIGQVYAGRESLAAERTSAPVARAGFAPSAAADIGPGLEPTAEAISEVMPATFAHEVAGFRFEFLIRCVPPPVLDRPCYSQI